LQQLTLKDTSNALWLRDLSASRDKVGDALFTMFDFAGAMQAYRASIEVAEHLAQRDPSNAEWQRDLSVSHNELAKVLLMQRDAAGALREYRAGLQIAERLAKKDTAEVAWQRDLWIAYYRQAEVSRKTGIADSLEWWRKSYRVLFALKRRVVSISPQDEKILEELRKKIGE
jgi:tetratricopeptide (TPR) repeat protein